jgi:predicted alpha/beta-hydrolase family hydrolase
MRHGERRFDIADGQQVSGIVALPDVRYAGTVVVLAHGAGTDMTNPLLVAVADALAEHGLPTVRFNFPYTERAGRRPDPAPVLEACYRAVVAQVRGDRELSARRLVIGGKSMGGRIASHVADRAGARGLVCLGYPFHPPRQPQKLRTAHLATLRTPTLIVQGTRDEFGGPDEVAGYALSPAIRLLWIDGGDHSFKPARGTARSERDNVAAAIAAVADFVAGLPPATG